MSAVVKIEPQTHEIAPALRMLEAAANRGASIEELEKWMALQERWQAAQAKRAYTLAFADFKQNMPDVVKDMLNKQYGSDYSSLANLVNTTNRELGKWGLNASWDIEQGDKVAVYCILTHAEGHSERVRIEAPQDTSGSKNALQQIKSTLTYLEGATFQAITGVVARSASKDDDGNGAGKKKAIPEPDGYQNWNADMTALADEGSQKLEAAWKASSADYRRYVIKCDEPWWEQLKRKAAKVQVTV
jgi:hypothetical protein